MSKAASAIQKHTAAWKNAVINKALKAMPLSSSPTVFRTGIWHKIVFQKIPCTNRIMKVNSNGNFVIIDSINRIKSH